MSANVKWLSASEQAAWRAWLYSGFAAIDGIDNDLNEDAGLDLLTYHILVQASEHDGIPVSGLAANVIASKQRIGQRVKTMTAEGLLEIQPSETDRRVKLVHATQKARDTLQQAAPGHVESVRKRVIDVLDEDDLAALAKISKKILAANS